MYPLRPKDRAISAVDLPLQSSSKTTFCMGENPGFFTTILSAEKNSGAVIWALTGRFFLLPP
ncbi:MAG: hypothetical protein WAK84_15260, partial [Candidatus Cybelea sp.]